jgi:hypothetical protein
MPRSISRLGFVASGSLLAIVAMSTVANARSTTAFNAFKVQNPNALPNACASAPGECQYTDFYQCLLEDNGAVYNNVHLLLSRTRSSVLFQT